MTYLKTIAAEMRNVAERHVNNAGEIVNNACGREVEIDGHRWNLTLSKTNVNPGRGPEQAWMFSVMDTAPYVTRPSDDLMNRLVREFFGDHGVIEISEGVQQMSGDPRMKAFRQVFQPINFQMKPQTPLFNRAMMDEIIEQGCQCPKGSATCNHRDPSGLFMKQRCHPGGGLFAIVTDGVLHTACAQCQTDVQQVAVEVLSDKLNAECHPDTPVEVRYKDGKMHVRCWKCEKEFRVLNVRN